MSACLIGPSLVLAAAEEENIAFVDTANAFAGVGVASFVVFVVMFIVDSDPRLSSAVAAFTSPSTAFA